VSCDILLMLTLKTVLDGHQLQERMDFLASLTSDTRILLRPFVSPYTAAMVIDIADSSTGRPRCVPK
jgi:hypothetical protein